MLMRWPASDAEEVRRWRLKESIRKRERRNEIIVSGVRIYCANEGQFAIGLKGQVWEGVLVRTRSLDLLVKGG